MSNVLFVLSTLAHEMGRMGKDPYGSIRQIQKYGPAATICTHLYFQEMPSILGKKFILGIFVCLTTRIFWREELFLEGESCKFTTTHFSQMELSESRTQGYKF